jgi:hypothetical protein
VPEGSERHLRYLRRDDGRPALPATITAIGIAVHTPTVDVSPPAVSPNQHPTGPDRPTRRSGHSLDARRAAAAERRGLADHLGVKPRNMLTNSLSGAAFLTRTSAGAYALPTRHAQDPDPWPDRLLRGHPKGLALTPVRTAPHSRRREQVKLICLAIRQARHIAIDALRQAQGTLR